MTEDYQMLLGATIRHLEELRRKGVRHVAIAQETWAALSATPAKSPATVPRPAGPRTSSPSAPQTPANQPTPIPASVRPRPPAPSAPPVPARAADSESKQPGFDALLPTPDRPPTPALSAEAKAEAMAALRTRALACQKCPHLVAARRNVVFGVGNIDSRLLFVGEAPGADEDEQGEPFVGKAGQLLTKIIQTMGFSRQDVYIANILKCRPNTPEQASGNRKPTPDEMKTCLPYLLEQIDLIQPRVMVALGATAVEGLLGKTVGITKLRGNWQQFRGIPVMPTYHPAYLLRNQSLAEKRRVWEDMLQVLERLGCPISDKQRGFFLSARSA